MLPNKDGWEVVAELRRGGMGTPILFLTARDSVRDRVKGLELGADDYLVKPFAFSELLARVRSVLRRAPAHQEDCLRIDDLELDLKRHKAVRSGVPLNLTPKSFFFSLIWFARPVKSYRAQKSPSMFGTSGSEPIRMSWKSWCAACGRRWTIHSRPN